MKLPLLLSVPHAGLVVPSSVAPLCALTPREVEEDGDEGAARIYDLADHAEAFVTSDVARAVVDLNRSEGDLSKDGVVKTHTCWDVPVWREPLSAELVEELLARHHRPYHAELRRLARREGVLVGVDCHTMAATAPPVAPDPGAERPMVCLSNGDGTCPDAWTEALAGHFHASFAGHEVRMNSPFKGGYIVRSHAAELPWVQVELSRSPALSMEDKRARVLAALTAWCAEPPWRAPPA